MRKVSNLIQKTLANNSAFIAATISAVIILVGDVMATGADILWLIGDMSIQTHAHHYSVFVGLSLALIVMLVSGIWLIKALFQFFGNKEIKQIKHSVEKVQQYNEYLDVDVQMYKVEKERKNNPYEYRETTD